VERNLTYLHTNQHTWRVAAELAAKFIAARIIPAGHSLVLNYAYVFGSSGARVKKMVFAEGRDDEFFP
jgi:hypothetical protein